MKFLAFDHVQLAMPAGEEAAAREFYVHILGLVEVPKPAVLSRRGGAWFEAGPVRLHLGVEKDFHPARKAHPALLVDDLDAILESCGHNGVEVDTSQPPLDGYRRVHIFDPFGNRIELMQAE